MGTLPGGGGGYYVLGLSADGQIAVGSTQNASGFQEAYSWAGAMTGLGFLAARPESRAASVSDDGTVIAGVSILSGNPTKAAQWTNGTIADLGYLPGGGSFQDSFAEAVAVSADGSRIIGSSTNANDVIEAFRFESGVMTALNCKGQATCGSRPTAANADASVIVGLGCGKPVCRWTATEGWEDVLAELLARGVDVSGWSPGGVVGVSGDGTVMVGGGSLSGNSESWMVRLPIPAGSATHDFDGGRKSDILWRSTGTPSSTVAMWLMNGGQIGNTASIAEIANSYQIIAQHDFDGDGSADLLWHDSSGNLYMWFMNGLAVASTAGLGNVDPNTWTIVGVADFNGDAMADILWQSSAGDLAVWFMNGSQMSSSALLGTVPPASGWSIIATTTGEILWRDSSGDIALWQVSGSTVKSNALGAVPNNWQVQHFGDFNGDGNADLLWRDTAAGAVAM